MTAVETLTRAIEVLEKLKSERGYFELNGWLVEEDPGDTARTWLPGDDGVSPITNDELIVALHRTIDAQLTILREALPHFTEIAMKRLAGYMERRFRNELALARAVLGETEA